MDIPRVAVLLAAYNGEKWIQDQIFSIIKQKGVIVSLYISIDLSTDNTKVLVDNLMHECPNIHVLSYGNRYGGAAPNFFRLIKDVSMNTFDYIAFSDQDDIWFSDKLLNAINGLCSTFSEAYSSNVIAFWQNGKKKKTNKSQEQKKYDHYFEAAGPGCTYVMTRNLAIEFQSFLWANANGIEKIYLHDWLLYAFARSQGYKWIIDDKASVFYRQHERNQVGINNGLFALTTRAVKVLSGKGFEQVFLILSLTSNGSDKVLKKWQSIGRMKYVLIATHALECRRKKSDAIILIIACLIYFILGKETYYV